MDDARFALFVMLGQTAERLLTTLPDIAPSEPMLLGPAYDLSALIPDVARQAEIAAKGYSLFFVFEAYVRDLVVDVLAKVSPGDWWAKVPKDVQDEVAKLEETEEAKRWMALGSRDKSALMTYPQLLRVIDHNWKPDFEELLRDRSLIQEARVISHLRNTLCHMTPISEEEMERVRQVLRDWFRMVAP